MKNRFIKLRADVISSASAVGGAESRGPLGEKFDIHDPDDRFGQSSWEKAESEMQRVALSIALKKASLSTEQLGALYAGDLLNQCVGSAYGLLSFGVPYFGLYGACSTSAEAMMLGAMAINAGYFRYAAAVTSSHNCSAERQYRTPIEYGGQKPPCAQWTVTGAGAFILGESGCRSDHLAEIVGVMPGTVIDKGITDTSNMGAAMAPAALDTLVKYFELSDCSPRDFELILTGDLGRVGSDILNDLSAARGLDLSDVHGDCGCMIYEGTARPDVNSGGSGCGCSATVLASHVLPRLASGEFRRILFLATGAMMSPSSVQQGLSIPAIAHLIELRSPLSGER